MDKRDTQNDLFQFDLLGVEADRITTRLADKLAKAPAGSLEDVNKDRCDSAEARDGCGDRDDKDPVFPTRSEVKAPHQMPPPVLVTRKALEFEVASRREFAGWFGKPPKPDKARTNNRISRGRPRE